MGNETVWQKLSAPFTDAELEWRAQQVGKRNDGSIWAIVVPFVQSRAIMQRLDDVLTPAGWQASFRETSTGVDIENKHNSFQGYICRLGVREIIEDDFVYREDGANATNVEAIKGGISGALKRAAVHFGIGRYLYDFDTMFVDVTQSSDQKCPNDGGNYIFINQKGDGNRKPDVRGWAVAPSQDGKNKGSAPPPERQQSSGSKQSSGGLPPGEYYSKYDVWCTVCGNQHPKGTHIRKHGKNTAGNQGYASVECIDGGADDAPPDNSTVGENESRILVLESLWIDSGIEANGHDMQEARLTYGGSADMTKMSISAMKNYIEHLESLGLEQ